MTADGWQWPRRAANLAAIGPWYRRGEGVIMVRPRAGRPDGPACGRWSLSEIRREESRCESGLCSGRSQSRCQRSPTSRAFSGADDDTPTIKEVMNTLHKGASSPLALLKGQLRRDSPDWATIQKETKDFVILGASLAKNDPPKGDKGSWKTLADGYFADAKALDDAANAKNLAAAQAAHKKLATSCKACHGAHKGK